MRAPLGLWLLFAGALIATLGCAVPGAQQEGGPNSPVDDAHASFDARFHDVATRPATQLDIDALSFDELIELDEDRIDAGLASVLMAYEVGLATRDDIRFTLERLDALAEEVLELRLIDVRLYDELPPALKAKRDERNAKRLVEFIVQRKGFRFDQADPEGHDPRNLFLHSVLRREKGYCVSLTKLAVALAQRLRVPVQAVRVPGHMFLRYDPHDDGTALDPNAVNFEMTAQGYSRPSTYYLERYNVHGTALSNGVYLRSLSVREMLSDVASNLGSLLYVKDRADEAVAWFERAIACDPRNSQAFYNLGTTYARLDQPRGALKAFRQALEYDAGDYLAYCARGRLYIEAGDPTLGFEDLERAISLRPEKAHAYQLRGVLRAKRGEFEQAEPDLRKALEIEPNDLGTIRNLVLVYLHTEQLEEALEWRTQLQRLHDGDEQTRQLLTALDEAERTLAAGGEARE